MPCKQNTKKRWRFGGQSGQPTRRQMATKSSATSSRIGLMVGRRKKLFKAHSKQAPKKAKSSYGIFAGEIRDRVKEAVMSAGGTMGDIGVKIAAEWAEVPEAKKAEYAEMAQRQKEEFDVLFGEHKKTDIYKKFLEDRAKMEGKHKLKKLERTTFKDAPAKPKSSFSLFKEKVLKQVMEENKGAAAGELSKKVGEKWKALTPEEKAPFESQANSMKQEYLRKLKDFKKNKTYSRFLLQRQMVRMRENRSVFLREAPKKPRSVFSLYREAHKDEVPGGKGEGKGMNWVKTKYQSAEQEEKEKIEAMQNELKQKYEEEMKNWKSGEKFAEFQKNEVKIKKEMQNEALKLMTLKFLDDAPPQPPKTPFAVYVAQKRKASQEGDGEPPAKKGRKELQGEVLKYQEEWKKLDKDLKSEFEDKRKELKKAWQEQAKEYMQQDRWKEYIQEAKTFKLPIKNLLSDKKQMIKKLKNGMKLAELPDKPEEMPVKPPGAYKLFVRAKKSEVEDVSQIPGLWQGATAEEKQKFEEEAKELLTKYDEALAAFKQSEDGKAYFRKMVQVRKSRTVAMAKDKYRSDVPQQPESAVKIYMRSTIKELKKEKPDMKGFELTKAIKDRWTALDDSEKQPFKDKAAAAEQEYQDKLKEWKASENGQKFSKIMKNLSRMARPKVKAKGKAKAKATPSAFDGPKIPESMPRKPPDALKAYFKDQTGKGKNLAAMANEFRALEGEEKEKYVNEAKEKAQKYQEELAAWQKTDEGKKYASQVKLLGKRKKIAMAKEKYLKEEPKKPPSGQQLFFSDKRPEVMKENPGFRGLQCMPKLAEMWKNLSDEERKVWTDKASGDIEEYENKLKEFQSSANYKKYLSIVKGSAKPKEKAAKKDAKAKAVGPPAPAGMPKRPPKAMGLFMEQNPGLGGLGPAAKKWTELGAEGQKKYVDEAKEKLAMYEKAMEEFRSTADGKKYFRLKEAAEKKSKLQQAKTKLLGGEGGPKEPKMPQSAYQLYVTEKRPTLTGSVGEVAKALSTSWSSLPEDEKDVFEKTAKELKEQYEKDMAEYKNSDGFKKFDKLQKSMNKKSAPKKVAKPKKEAKPKKAAGGKGRGRGAGAKAAAKAKAKAKADDSDSDVMGSDSSSSDSSSDSD